MTKYHPSELETQVLSVLWEQGPSTVRQVLSRLPDGKQRAYTTVLTIMQGMEKKKLVSRTRDGAAHVYHPEVQREEVGQPVIKTLLKQIFAGDASRVVQALVESEGVSPEDLDQIRSVIDQAENKLKEQGDES